MICTDLQRVSFSPSQQPVSCHESYYQPSAHNFSLGSEAVISNQPISHGCPTSSMRLVQQPVLPTFPPVHHPSNTPSIKVSFTYVHLMTVEQTSNWILTMGAFKGWKEASTYAENFRKNSITGMMLPRLNHELLKFELGMLDHSHRLELIATVRQLFPSYIELVPRVIPSTPSTLSGLSGMLETDTESDLLVKTIPSPPSLVLRGSSAPKVSNLQEQAEEYEPCMNYLIKEQEDPVLMDLSPQQNCSVKSDSEYSTRSTVTSSSEVGSRSSTAFSLDFSESNLQKLPMVRARRSFFVEPKIALKGVSDNSKTLTKSGTATRSTWADLLKVRAMASTICSSTPSETSCATGLTNMTISSESPKSLLLTLPLNKVVRTGNIRSNFLKFQFVVRVEPLKKRSCWLIIFQSIEEAKRALSISRQIGYNLEPYTNDEPRKLMRPTPRNPIEYRVLSKVTIRSGKSLRGEIVGELYKNKIVTINKIKGRRARIIKKGSANSPVTVGWVSSHTVEGIPLLEQM